MTSGDGPEPDDRSGEELQRQAQRVWRKIKVASLIVLVLCISALAVLSNVAYRSIGSPGTMIAVAGVGVAVILLVRHLEYY